MQKITENLTSEDKHILIKTKYKKKRKNKLNVLNFKKVNRDQLDNFMLEGCE
jgi:hypothetical protein